MISIWEQESFYAPQDVIIAGGGFTGLWAAYYLKKKKPSLRITIIDRGLIPTGASTRNAGFACFGSLSEVIADARSMGTEQMLELVNLRFRGLEKIQDVFPHGIDFDMCGGYELYDGISKPAASIQDDIEYVNSLVHPITGSRNTYKLADDLIQTFGFGKTSHIVRNKLEGYLHSGKLVQALISKVSGLGVSILTGMDIREFTECGDGFQLSLKKTGTDIDAPAMQASRLLLCTNAFTSQLWPEIDIVPARGQVLLTSPIEGLPWSGTFHSDEGFYYFRNLGNRVLLGGARNTAFEDERTTAMEISQGIQNTLENYLTDVVLPQFGGQYQIERRWSGIMAMGSEKLPIIRELKPGVFCAVRMSGMGVALAPVAARKVSKMVLQSL